MTRVQVSSNAQLLTIAPEGVLSVNDVIQIVEQHYSTFKGRRTLWDLSQADVAAITREDFGKIAAVVRKIVQHGEPRKTAYVVTDSPTFAKMCKYLNETISAGVPVEYSVFTNRAAAQRWLDQA